MPDVAFLVRVERGEVYPYFGRYEAAGPYTGGLVQAHQHANAGYVVIVTSWQSWQRDTVRLTDAGRAALTASQAA